MKRLYIAIRRILGKNGIPRNCLGRAMSDKQRVHLFTLCWNDARMLPFFFRHYDPVVDHYFIYDNGSSDQSLEILRKHGRVTVQHFDVAGDSFVDEERRLSDTVWKQSRGAADWVIVLDIDEHAYHPQLAEYLVRCARSGVTALRGIGYEMICDRFPEADATLVDCVTVGVRSAGHDKFCIFNPDAVTESFFGHGRHTAEPEGAVKWPHHPELLLLHYKELGVEYVIRRSAELRQGLRAGDMAEEWGIQYTWSSAEIADKWAKLRAVAGPVPGLGSLSHIPPALYDDEHVVADSGLFDAQWYLTTYPDIEYKNADALSHYCMHGWKEHRKPNYYFQPKWYVEQHPELRDGRNPLLHYIVTGEREGARPSPDFDTTWYRQHHGLGPQGSPLRHYLEHRRSATHSPLPSFDVVGYVEQYPRRITGLEDPYEEYVLRRNLAADTVGELARLPSYREVLAVLEVDPCGRSEDLTVPAASLIGAMQLLLCAVTVDEQWYCETYPDVAAAIAEGSVDSAREHFIEFGYFEGRRPAADPREDD